MANETTKKTSSISSEKTKDLIFYCVMFALPVIQFCIFYIGVNFNSILLAFKSYSRVDGSYTFVGFENFTSAFKFITESSIFITSIKNSLIKYGLHLIISVPLALIFSYYIFKKMPGATVFRIILFTPSVIASIVMVIIFNYFVDRALPVYMQNLFGIEIAGLLSNNETSLATVFSYSIWIGFGVSVLMYTSTMCSIDDSIVESAELDGANNIREFFSIVLPLVWPTLTTFLVVSVAQICVDQNNVFSFYGARADEKYYNIGYYLYVEAQGSEAGYPQLAAMGLMLTLVIVPITFVVKFLLEKLGPSAD